MSGAPAPGQVTKEDTAGAAFEIKTDAAFSPAPAPKPPCTGLVRRFPGIRAANRHAPSPWTTPSSGHAGTKTCCALKRDGVGEAAGVVAGHARSTATGPRRAADAIDRQQPVMIEDDEP